MGGSNTDGYPCTLNGFLAPRNGEVVPEFRCIKGEEIKPKKGAELHMVVDGKDTIIGEFKKSFFEKIDKQ